MMRRVFWSGLLGLALVGSAMADEAWPAAPAPLGAQAGEPAADVPATEEGLASWYGGRRWHGRRTTSGEPFDRHAFTAAHRRLPLGSWVRVVNLANGREVRVRINDRGPRSRRYVIDLSEAAAQQLGFRRQGVATVALHGSSAPEPQGNALAAF